MTLRRLLALVTLASLCLTGLPAAAPASAPGTPTSYAETLALAQKAAAENSWTRARDAYAQLLPQAPDETTRRWLELWLLDATWRAEDVPNYWQGRNIWMEERTNAYAKLLKPYDAGQAHDDYFLDILSSRAGFFFKIGDRIEAGEDLLRAADVLAGFAPTTETKVRYTNFVRQWTQDSLTRDIWNRRIELVDRLIDHLDRAAKLAETATDRAGFVLKAVTYFDEIHAKRLSACATRWAAALRACQGTPFEAQAKAREFIFRIETGYDRQAAPATPFDLPARLAEARDLLAALSLSASPKEELKPLEEKLRTFERAWTEPWLRVHAPEFLRPGQPLQLTYGATGYTQLTIRLYRHSLASWAERSRDARQLSRQYSREGDTLTRDDLNAEAKKLRNSAAAIVQTMQYALPESPPLAWHTGSVALAPAMEPGFYTLAVDVTGAGREDTVILDVVVTSLQAISAISPTGRATLHIFQSGNSQPVTDQSVEAVIFAEKTHSMWSGRLDTAGMVEIPLPTQEALRWKGASLAALVGSQPLVVDGLRYGRWTSLLVADMILDRELYRPGETVHWKLIVREFTDGRFVHAAPKTPLSLNFEMGDDTQADSQEIPITLNAFGTAHGSFAIPATARPGAVRVQLKNPGREDDDIFPVFSAYFQIDNYIRPPVQASLKLASAPETLIPGADITVHVQANYYSGGPVTGAPVALYCRPQLGAWAQNEIHQYARSMSDQWVLELNKKSFTAVTDADGVAYFNLKLPDFIPVGTSLNFTASVSPDGSPVTKADANWQVTASGFLVDASLWPETKAARPGESVSFACRIVNGQNLPASFRGVASFVELHWSEAWLNAEGAVVTGAPLQAARRELGIKPDGDLPKPWGRLHAGYANTVVEEKRVQTDADGRIQVSFTPEHAGIYQLQIKPSVQATALPTFDAQSWRPKDPSILIVADEATTSLPIRPGIHLISPDNVVAGQPQKFLAVLPEGSSTGLFALAGVSSLVTKRVTFPGCVGWIVIDHPPAQTAQGTAWLTPLEGDDDAVTAKFSVLDPAQRLALTVQPQAAEVRPGSDATVSLAALDAAGQPVAAEVAVSISDESVNALTARADHSPVFWKFKPHELMGLSKHFQVDNMPADLGLPDTRPGAYSIRFSISLSDASGLGDGEEGVTTLSPFEVSSDKEYGYLRTNSATATKIGLKIQDMPLDISTTSQEFSAIILRRFFSSTAAWEPALTTDARGQAQFNFRYPDNLTRWRIEAYAVGRDGNTFGQASAFTQTSLPFQARLQTPRFLTVGDTVDLSAAFVSRTDAAQTAQAQLTVEGAVQLAAGESPERDGLFIPAQGETRIAWHTQAITPGEAQLTLKARSASESDGMALGLPVQLDGFWQKTAASARLAGNARQQAFDLDLPSPLDPRRVQVALKLSPGIYPALLDALPYLVDYPYGCVEQTMNRFLPAIIVRKALVDFGLDAAAVEKRILADESPFAADRRKKSAGLTKLDDVVQASLARLTEARIEYGGFGWWPGQEDPDPWMTAYVVWGLGLASEAGISVSEAWKQEIEQALCQLLSEKSVNPSTRAWMLAALTRAKLSGEYPELPKAAFADLYAARDQLSAHGRACLALASAAFGSAAEHAVLLRNLENGAQRATAAGLGDTVHWGSTASYWRATDGAVESTALTLLALLKLEPTHPLVEPAANWLLLNRRSSGWTNTRDTAFAVLALSAYAAVDHQSTPSEEVEIHANGRFVGAMKATPDSVFASTLTMPLPAQSLQPGKNRLELRRLSGHTTLYALALTSAWAENVTVKPAGHLVEAARQFERQQATPTLAGTLRLVPSLLTPGASATAGEKITAIVTLTVPNELEYLMVEVPKPAGCEPFNPLSGWDAQLSNVPSQGQAKQSDDTGIPLYREEHDDRSVFFLDHVRAGTWEIRFALRATTPGDYRAAPVKVEAMYAPEIRANTDAQRVKITPRTD